MSLLPQSDDVIHYLLQKADQALESARSEFQAQRFDFAINRAYYACFYAASAVILQRGKQFVTVFTIDPFNTAVADSPTRNASPPI